LQVDRPTAATLAGLWRVMDAALDAELAVAKVSIQALLKARNPVWNLVGRVHFNLAENRKDERSHPLLRADAARDLVGIWCGAISGNMKVSFQAARSIG
jgi:hypothetical protein